MTRVALFTSIALGIGSLAIGYAGSGWFALLILAFGIIWFYTEQRGWAWFSMIGLTLAVFIAMVGVQLEFNSGWMFAGVLFSLFAWDLVEFRNRLQFASIGNNVPGMEKRHLLRLGILAIVATILLLLIIFVRLQFSFGWLIFLAIVTALGLTQLVSQFSSKVSGKK
jgi:hypothetical protein